MSSNRFIWRGNVGNRKVSGLKFPHKPPLRPACTCVDISIDGRKTLCECGHALPGWFYDEDTTTWTCRAQGFRGELVFRVFFASRKKNAIRRTIVVSQPPTPQSRSAPSQLYDSVFWPWGCASIQACALFSFALRHRFRCSRPRL